MSDPAILAFDTSAAHCAAALRCGPLRDARLEHLQRGQAERLMPLLEELLAGHGLGWRDLDAVAVGTGPGNFTGVRISVAAARGLALALGIPAIGVSLFEILADPDDPAPEAATLVSLEAPRGRAYVQPMRDGAPAGAPRMIDPADPPADLGLSATDRVLGHRAGDIARPFAARWTEAAPADIAARIAAVAERRLAGSATPPARPAPIYVRPPDAAPPREAPPALLP